MEAIPLGRLGPNGSGLVIEIAHFALAEFNPDDLACFTENKKCHWTWTFKKGAVPAIAEL